MRRNESLFKHIHGRLSVTESWNVGQEALGL